MIIRPFLLSLAVLMSVAVSAQTSRLIIKLKSSVASAGNAPGPQNTIGLAALDSVTRKFGAVEVRKQATGRKSRERAYLITFPEGTDLQPVIEQYYRTRLIDYAEPDHPGTGGGTQLTTPNDTYYSRQWGLRNTGTFSLSAAMAGADIDMENAWTIEQGDSTVTVGVIDSGVKLNHPEFAGRIWRNNAEIPANGSDDDNNGYIDDVQGWDFVNSDNNPSDDFGHGTNVTGIIGANGNNATGYAGVDWHCKLMILKGLDNNNNGYYSWWADAIYYAVDNGAKVINMSVGGTGTSATLQAAVDYALNNNVLVVACMMNANSGTVYYPAGFSSAMAVGATNPNDQRSHPFFWSAASGSNYGSHISVVAPGNFIYGLSHTSNTNYGTYWGGTSQATPYVTGLAALLLAQDSSRTPTQLKAIIEASAEDQVGAVTEDVPGWDPYYGHGRINAAAALQAAITGTAPLRPDSRGLLVFPNPFSTEAVLPLDNVLRDGTLSIYNGLGQCVKQLQAGTGQSLTLYRDGLPAGVYLLRLSGDGAGPMSGKIVISD